MDLNVLYYIWLNTSLRAGSSAPKILLEHYKSIKNVFEASYEDYLLLGISKKDARKLSDKNLDMAKEYYNFCVNKKIGVLCYDHPLYPGRLKCISDPPAMFYYKGKVEMLDDYPSFAMVGTRSCSENGLRYSYRLGYKAAARGAAIVNGLALGCDAGALTGALDADGYAVGILGCGIDKVYPAGNKALYERLSKNGLILSEFAPFSAPEGRNFPVRNRVISGMTLATVILEADANSGAMITAAHAYSQGKKIYAIPGDIVNKLYEGPLQLIKNGAKTVTDADDFILEYALMFPHRIALTENVLIPKEKENDLVNLAFSAYEIAKKTDNEKKRTLPEPGKMVKKTKTSKALSDTKEVNADKPEEKNTFAKPEEKSKSEYSPNKIDLSPLSAPEQMIMRMFFENETLSVDEIASKGIKVDDVLSSLTMLEIYGYLTALPGGRYIMNK